MWATKSECTILRYLDNISGRKYEKDCWHGCLWEAGSGKQGQVDRKLTFSFVPF